MLQLETSPSPEAVENSQVALAANEYPGRVLIQGLNVHGNMALQVYALTGRSEGSRNRIFIEEELEHDIRVVAPDKTEEEMQAVENAALIYYPAMMSFRGIHVVSNGAQTETVLDSLVEDDDQPSLLEAVKRAPIIQGIDLSIYEPDSPNNTPRITGVINLNAGAPGRFAIVTVRKDLQSVDPRYSAFSPPRNYPTISLKPGIGFGVQTYNGNGTPLPSFDQQPYPVALGEGVEDTAHAIWSLLNHDNRVAIVVKGIDLTQPPLDHAIPEYHIINGREQ